MLQGIQGVQQVVRQGVEHAGHMARRNIQQDCRLEAHLVELILLAQKLVVQGDVLAESMADGSCAVVVFGDPSCQQHLAGCIYALARALFHVSFDLSGCHSPSHGCLRRMGVESRTRHGGDGVGVPVGRLRIDRDLSHIESRVLRCAGDVAVCRRPCPFCFSVFPPLAVSFLELNPIPSRAT